MFFGKPYDALLSHVTDQYNLPIAKHCIPRRRGLWCILIKWNNSVSMLDFMAREKLDDNTACLQSCWRPHKSIWHRFIKTFCVNILKCFSRHMLLIHWGRLTPICVSELTIIGSDNGLSPGRRQAIIWTNAAILLILTLGTNFSEILSENRTFSFKKMHLKISSAKCWQFVSA